MPPDLQPARSKLARVIWDAMVNDEPPDDETLEREGYFDAADAVLRGSSRPTDRPDAYCADCPFSDRGDWVMHRAEYEALVEARENANTVSVRVEAENRRLLNIINVAAEYLRDPERGLAEGCALAALALDKADPDA